jgi:uncharacterized protein YcnI
MKYRFTLLAAVAAPLVLAPAAAAHVEISPAKVAADSFAHLTIEVPTERNVPTVKLEVKLPPGLGDVRLATKPGWKSTNRDGVITWSGGKIAPGHSDRFVFKVHMPNTPGKELLFPAIQTYAKGPVVRWIGAPGSETPAPRVMLEAAATQFIGTVTLNDGGGGHRGIVLGIGIALIGGLLALAIVIFRKRRA